MGRDARAMRRRFQVVEDASTTRGRDQSDKAGEFHFGDAYDYVKFTAGLINKSGIKYSTIAKTGGMSPSTASNLASGKTHYPRFSTISGILGSLGYETVIRGSALTGRKK